MSGLAGAAQVQQDQLRYPARPPRSPRYALARIGPPGKQITEAAESEPEPMT